MMENISHYYIGIDISKETFDVYVLPLKKHKCFKNNNEGFVKLLSWIEAFKQAPITWLCESTGGYEKALNRFLYKNNYSMIIENPRKIHHFGKAIGALGKTDKQDAKLIALYAERIKPTAYFKDPAMEPMTELHDRQAQVKKIIQAEKNRLENASDLVADIIQKHIDFLEKELEDITNQIDEMVETNESLKEKLEIVISFCGVGKTIAHTLVVALPELGNVNKKALSALVGVAPLNKDSGKKIGKRMIWGGRGNIRRQLYMGALVATKHNPPIRQFYQKLLAAGKPKKVAIVACMRKMLCILNVMVKNKELWVPRPGTHTKTVTA